MLDASTLHKNITFQSQLFIKTRKITQYCWDGNLPFYFSFGRCGSGLPTTMNLLNMLECVATNVFYLSILIISQLVSQVIAADERFIVPSNDSKSLSYREGSMLNLAWDTSLDRIALTLWQDGIDSLEYIGGLLCNQSCQSSCALI